MQEFRITTRKHIKWECLWMLIVELDEERGVFSTRQSSRAGRSVAPGTLQSGKHFTSESGCLDQTNHASSMARVSVS
jgi:hypothetical protein